MNVVILAGGFGTRLSEETEIRPKPMVDIGGKPILWHIMKHYAHHGFKEFFIALGYKGEAIKHYMIDYNMLNSNIVVRLSSGEVEIKEKQLHIRIEDTVLITADGPEVLTKHVPKEVDEVLALVGTRQVTSKQ